jgi:hypothetical protein
MTELGDGRGAAAYRPAERCRQLARRRAEFARLTFAGMRAWHTSPTNEDAPGRSLCTIIATAARPNSISFSSNCSAMICLRYANFPDGCFYASTVS